MMEKKLGSFKIYFAVCFNAPIGAATLKLRSISETKKIKVKFALEDEPNILLNFNELMKKYLELPIPKGFNPYFYIINEETEQKAKIIIPIARMWPPNARGGTAISAPPKFIDISKQIKKIGG